MRPSSYLCWSFIRESASGKPLDFDSSMRRFDPYLPYHLRIGSSVVEPRPVKPVVVCSIHTRSAIFRVGVGQLVGRLIWVQEITAGSSPVTRTIFCLLMEA